MVVSSSHPDLKDFRDFHGMFCNLLQARRCIGAFNGSILFQPMAYTGPLSKYDYSVGPKPLRLGVISYYLLVFLSLTGWSSLIGRTKCLKAEEEDVTFSTEKPLASETHPDLVARTDIWQYLAPGSNELTLKRRFEFEFGGGAGIQVVMLHIWDNKRGTLNLVEVVKCKSKLLLGCADLIQGILSFFRARDPIKGEGEWRKSRY